ncbi:helix-turn-helix transcriptional regulator [uncultured Nevskia sp.]|uniref:helix-turn-helix domain-containing protein n=1 Tax=uncultured Nevskia sp. TaxID=228950 RepID=UPI0025D09460|nr:helix-turn-helix transcriptional regulator [uncultured Nevskia sp.]
MAFLLAEKKLKIADVSRDTGLNRSTLTAMYYETTQRIDLESVNALCRYFGCKVEDLFVYVPDGDGRTD